ncbi:MAG: hypothetical protein GY754_05310 [bacterium]|nr:hypothetical protein [bacterium]
MNMVAEQTPQTTENVSVNMFVNQNEDAVKEVKDICRAYLTKLVEFIDNPEASNAFREDPVAGLNSIGMKIPEGVAVVLNDSDLRWPRVYIHTNDQDNPKYVIIEGKRSFEVITNLAEMGQRDLKTIEEFSPGSEIVGPARLDQKIQESFNECCKIVVEMPFYDIMDDMLLVVDFNDSNDKNIILSSC